MERDYKWLTEQIDMMSPEDTSDIAESLGGKGACLMLTWKVIGEQTEESRAQYEPKATLALLDINIKLENALPGKIKIWNWTFAEDHAHMVIYTAGSGMMGPLVDEIADKLHNIVTGENCRDKESGVVGIYGDEVLTMLCPMEALPYLNEYLERHDEMHWDMTYAQEIEMIQSGTSMEQFTEKVRAAIHAEGIEIFGDKNPIDAEYARVLSWIEGKTHDSEYYDTVLKSIRLMKQSISKVMASVEAEDKPQKLN